MTKADRCDVPGQVLRPRSLVLGARAVDEGRERHLRVDDDPFPLGQVEDHVGPQVVARSVLEVVLRVVVHPFDEVRVVENRLQNHLAPVALDLRIALERVGQIGGLGRDAAVQLHQVAQLVLQRAALLGLRRVDLLHPLAELRDVLPERLQQQIHRLAVGLFELLRLLAQNLGRQRLELQPQRLLLLFAPGLFGFALLGAAGAERRDLGLRCGFRGRQFPFQGDARLGLSEHALLGIAERRFRGLLLFRQAERLAACGVPCGTQGGCQRCEQDDREDNCGIHTNKGSNFSGIPARKGRPYVIGEPAEACAFRGCPRPGDAQTDLALCPLIHIFAYSTRNTQCL